MFEGINLGEYEHAFDCKEGSRSSLYASNSYHVNNNENSRRYTKLTLEGVLKYVKDRAFCGSNTWGCVSKPQEKETYSVDNCVLFIRNLCI